MDKMDWIGPKLEIFKPTEPPKLELPPPAFKLTPPTLKRSTGVVGDPLYRSTGIVGDPLFLEGYRSFGAFKRVLPPVPLFDGGYTTTPPTPPPKK